MTWEDNFQTKILLRGYDIFEDKNLKIEKDGDIASTKIKGTDKYYVSINIKDAADDEKYYCDCPYFESGNNCKHLAALLYCCKAQGLLDNAKYLEKELKPENYLKNNLNLELNEKSKEFLLELINFLIDKNKISNLDLDEFIEYKKINSDDGVFEVESQIINDYVDEYGDPIMIPVDKIEKSIIDKKRDNSLYKLSDLINEYECIIDSNSDDGFIDYYSGFDFTLESKEYLDRAFNTIISKANVKLGVKFAIWLFKKIDIIELDGSSGEHEIVLDNICDNLIRLLNICSLEEREEILRELLEFYYSHDDSEVSAYNVEGFIIDRFREVNLKDIQLEFISRLESKYKSSTNVNIYSDYKLRELKLKRDYGENIDNELLEIIYNDNALNLYINNKIEKQEYHNLLELLLHLRDVTNNVINSKQLEEVNEFIKYHWHDYSIGKYIDIFNLKIKDLYKEIGDYESYYDELIYLIKNHQYFSEEEFKDLKKNIDNKKWEDLIEIFKVYPYRDGIVKFYIDEGIMEYSLRFSIDELKYDKETFKIIIGKLPNKILEKYKKEIYKNSKEVAERWVYKSIAHKIYDMREINGGLEMGINIARDLVNTYKRRWAMKEEFEKVLKIKL